ncbi:MAG: hypothetical protein AMK73_02955 [Planctomycetes bacterium SM23_32]|nr:MAG: hypothetical protein AMK73_02955 [Planctomycetes bacterium SM23_32]
MSDYDHKQVCPLTVLVLAAGIACGMAAGAALVWGSAEGALSLAVLGWGGMVFAAFFAGAFLHMRVRDRGDALAIEYGPVTLVHREVPYDAVASVEVTAIGQLQMWQVRQGRPMRVYAVRRGPAVQVNLKKLPGERLARAVLIGTDDAEGLVGFLRGRLGAG